MNFSHWEYETWLHHTDTTVRESCIERLNSVKSLQKKFTRGKIVKFVKKQLFSLKNNDFCFKNLQKQLIFSQFEG